MSKKPATTRAMLREGAIPLRAGIKLLIADARSAGQRLGGQLFSQRCGDIVPLKKPAPVTSATFRV